jgi:hypothetical protein
MALIGIIVYRLYSLTSIFTKSITFIFVNNVVVVDDDDDDDDDGTFSGVLYVEFTLSMSDVNL